MAQADAAAQAHAARVAHVNSLKEKGESVTVHFETGADELQFNPGEQEIVDEICEAMVEEPSLRIIITGHTDNSGDPEKNLRYFGKKRAESLKAYMVSKGVSADPTQTPSEPTGILTTLSTPSVQTADSATISFDDIYKLFYALKAPYRKKAKFLCNETALLQLMLLKDNNKQYIWKPGLEVGKPDTILGHEIYTSTYMPAIEGNATNDAGKKVLLFGDFSYFWIADRTNRTMRRLNELYAMTDQVGFVGTQRVDGKLILPEAMKVLAMGAKANG